MGSVLSPSKHSNIIGERFHSRRSIVSDDLCGAVICRGRVEQFGAEPSCLDRPARVFLFLFFTFVLRSCPEAQTGSSRPDPMVCVGRRIHSSLLLNTPLTLRSPFHPLRISLSAWSPAGTVGPCIRPPRSALIHGAHRFRHRSSLSYRDG